MSGVYPYPNVLDEFKTIEAALAGKSIARIGDGEWKVMRGSSAAREAPNKDLARELCDVLSNPHPNLLPCVPTMNPEGPKYPTWKKHIPHVLQFFEEGVVYGSAFISRPDSAPWIENFAYCDMVRDLWTSKRVLLVSELNVSIYNVITRQPHGPAHFTHVECPHEGTYSQIGRIHKLIVRSAPDIAILSCGPAATVLAHRLAKNGIQAIDIGSAGQFLARNLNKVAPE
jgi:hypothetical protein